MKADPTDWLLEEDDPGVRYLALRDIVEASEKEIKTARQKSHREGPIARILDNMNPEGYWIRPGNVYADKCRGTVWSIISLGQLGAFVEEDERIATACSYLLSVSLSRGGQFSNTGKLTTVKDCLQGNMLTSLLDMGFKDRRLDSAFEWMARTVTGEGLAPAEDTSAPLRYVRQKIGPRFACRMNKNMPCAWGGVKVMTAFSRLPIEQRSDLIDRSIEVGIDYFFSVDPITADFPGEMAPEPDKRWWLFRFPLFWVADILQVAEALTRLGYGNDPRLASTLDFIRGKQDEAGRLPLEHVDYNHKMWVKYGIGDRPNKWITLRALRVLKQAEM